MPTKLKPSQKIRNKATGKYTTEHFYLKCMSIDALNKYKDASNSKPKTIQKCRNELVRRNRL